MEIDTDDSDYFIKVNKNKRKREKAKEKKSIKYNNKIWFCPICEVEMGTQVAIQHFALCLVDELNYSQSRIGCDQVVGNKIQCVRITIGNQDIQYCTARHLQEEETLKRFDLIAKEELKKYKPNLSTDKCQQCNREFANFNVQLQTTRETTNSQVYRPYYYCSIACLKDCIKHNGAAVKWSSFFKMFANG